MKIIPENATQLMNSAQHKIKVEPMAVIFFCLGMFMAAFMFHTLFNFI